MVDWKERGPSGRPHALFALTLACLALACGGTATGPADAADTERNERAATAQTPGEVPAHLEQRVDLDGELEVFFEDYPDGSARLRHFLKADGKRISLHFDADPPGLLSGTKVRARGVRLGDAMALDSAESILTLAAAGGANGGSNGGTPAAVPTALGEHRTLLILVNFADAPTQPYTPEEARTVMFGTTSEFFLENSFQQSWLTGDVAGWFTIAASSSACDIAAIASQAESAASAAGVDLGAYAHRVYAFPQNYACGFWGKSTLGGSPSQSWINGRFELGVTAHELGHAFGLFHSHSLDCGPTTLGASCTASEYGDTLDMMGSSASAHFTALQKERLGWLGSGTSTVPEITTIENEGTYSLAPYALAGQGPKALKILKSTDPTTGRRTWYYVEARQPFGFDGYLATYPNVVGGVLIHLGTESNGNSSHLLDMTPGTGSTLSLDWRDPALVVGQTFHDPDAGITLTTDSATDTGATVTVRFDETLAVSTDRSSYSRGDSVFAKATVRSGGRPVASASVTFTITKSNGAVVTGRATTGSDGIATYKLRLRRDDPVGTYQAEGAASGIAASAATSFIVR